MIGAALLAVPAAAGSAEKTAEKGDRIIRLERTAQALGNVSALDKLGIQAGDLAKEKGGTTDIRRFGDRLARDYRLAQQLVEADARRLGIDIRKPNREPGTARHFLVGQLEHRSGKSFDETFLNTAEQTSQQADELLAVMSGRVSDDRTRSLFAELRPIVRQHEELATILQFQPGARHSGGEGGSVEHGK
jgi:predicted outer membrane protein